MDILQLEQKYSNLKIFLTELSSKRTKLFKISEYFSLAFQFDNPNLLEAYISEFIPDFISYAQNIEVKGINPELIQTVLSQLEFLKKQKCCVANFSEIEISIESIKQKKELAFDWINGKTIKPNKGRIYFPVLEKSIDGFNTGYLESISIEIKNGEQKFHISPSELENDEQLEKQIKFCYGVAISYCKNFNRKIKPSHTVYLHFESRLGIYSGNSLGIALTLAFIETILKHYNSPTVVKVNDVIAVTGGIDNQTKIISTSKVIIEAKVETVFYSDAAIFCVPKVDEMWAEEKFKELKNRHPNKQLKIIGLTDLEDLLSRRNVVDIRKQKIVVRMAKFTAKKWKSVLLAAVLTMFFTYVFAFDFDDNPAMFMQDDNLLSVQNKNSKILWSTRMNFSSNHNSQNRTLVSRKIVDINNDGINEVILCEEEISPDKYNYGRVACFDNYKKLIWEYNFRDTVATFRKWSHIYQISIIDTTTISQKKILILMARNLPNFANAVFTIDLLTGQRYDSTQALWNAGGLSNGLTGDFNEDGTKEIVLAGMHNGFQRAIFFSVDIGKIQGQTPAPERYVFNNIPKAKLNTFILLPHTDYGKYFWRSNTVPYNCLTFTEHSKEFMLSTYDGMDKPITIYYGFDNRLNYRWVDCGDDAQKYRDSLVAKGILDTPYTNTSEYFKILKDEIKYWNGKNFLSIDELK